MKYIFIVNPVSGKSNGLIVGKVIEEYCKNNSFDYNIIYTEKNVGATLLANRYSTENTVIYSVGGDGTLNEVVNGIMGKNSKLCVIPAGSGNDFYKSLTSPISTLDVGKVNDRYFINIASLGLDAETAVRANNLKKYKLPSSLLYVIGLIESFIKYRGIDITTEEVESLTLIAICNGRYYGGGFKIAPNAILDDGMFDVIKANKMGKIETLKLLVRLLKSTHLTAENVSFNKTDSLIIDSILPLACNVDGEIIKDTHFDFSIKKSAIDIYKDDIGIIKVLKQKGVIK